MDKPRKPILDVLAGRDVSNAPIWIMRQAGRYLPEYRELRAKAKDFLNLCLTPEWASEITLQPIRRFGFDAAIIFADILLVPKALGQPLEFREGEGPVLEPIQSDAAIENLSFELSKVSPVFEALTRVKKELPSTTTLIGFCGSPWTVACYMIDGTSRNGFSEAKRWMRESPEKLDRLINLLIDSSVSYLSAQVEAGAEVVQLFDSWSGLLAGAEFDRFVIKPTQRLVARLKAAYPDIPVIGFPREAGAGYRDYVINTGVDAMSIDQSVNLSYAKSELQSVKPLQGNLDPTLVVEGGERMIKGTEAILRAMGPQHIFNLGHGITPNTPLENVAALIETIRQFSFTS